jgi:hypothetical protein
MKARRLAPPQEIVVAIALIVIAPGQRQCLAASTMFKSAQSVSPHLLRGYVP